MTKSLNINDIDVVSGHALYTCYGLGSCVGLFVTDRIMNLSGAAHIPLPRLASTELQAAEPMIEELLNRFIRYGSNLAYLRAKIAGGANMYCSNLDTGTENVNVVTSLLRKNKVYLAASDVGGTASRTARYNTTTGVLHIRTSDRQEYYL